MPGIQYYFAVTAVSTAGVESARSTEIAGAIPLLAPPENRTSTVGVPIVDMQLYAQDPDGGTVRFTDAGLPPGLFLDSSSGVIRGVPQSTGTFPVTVSATDGVLTSWRTFDWTVLSAGSGNWSDAGSVSSAPLSVTSLTSDRSSPTLPGTTVNFVATTAGGAAPYQFKWWVQIGGVWYVGQEWSNSPWFSWQPTTSGNHMVAVWARNAGVTADASQAFAQVPFVVSSDLSWGSSTPLSITRLDSDGSSPSVPGTTINFAASAAGGAAPYEFKWWVQSGGVWYVAQEWSTSATFAWRPTTPGNYMVAVWGRNAGVTVDASQALAQVPHVISSGYSSGSSAGLSITSLVSNASSPTPAWTSINFAATAAGGTAPYEFKWWVQIGGVWYVARDWSTTDWFTWQPTTSGNHMVAVWARNAGVTADASQALAQMPWVIAP